MDEPEIIIGIRNLLSKYPDIKIRYTNLTTLGSVYYSIYTKVPNGFPGLENIIEMARIWVYDTKLMMSLDSRFIENEEIYHLSEMNSMHRRPYCVYEINLHKFDPSQFVKILLKSTKLYPDLTRLQKFKNWIHRIW